MTAKAKKVEEDSGSNGNGSYAAPYRRKDGAKMVKWSLSVPIDFAQRFRAHTGTLPLDVTASEWVVATLMKEIEKEQR